MKIFKSLFVIFALAVLAIGATGAVFTDSKAVNGMTFSTGTLEITDVSESWTKSVVFDNLKPGDTERKWVVLQNTGSIDIGSLTVTANNIVGDADLLENIKISTSASLPEDNPATFTDDWGAESFVLPWMNQADILNNSYYRDPAGVIPAGSEYTITLDFSIPTDVGDDMQNKSVTFDMVFDAEQVQ